MHGSVRNNLEDLLMGKQPASEGQGLRRHLSDCSECSAEVGSMKTQSELLKALRAPEEMEPTPGFYARVIQRIEERAKDSIWAAFLYSQFGTRLAYASLTIALVLGTYVVAQESRDGHLGTSSAIAQDFHYDAPVTGSQAQQRDAVLANFAIHQGSLQ